jgi:hypothetical protein
MRMEVNVVKVLVLHSLIEVKHADVMHWDAANNLLY